MSGLLIDGELVEVPGVRILSPLEEPWNKLVRGKPRTWRPRFKILHKTLADDPERVLETPGPSARWGGAKDTIKWWQERKNDWGHAEPVSGTQIVTGHDGSTCCTADLIRYVGWHAHEACDYSWGHEIKERTGGVVHRTALFAAVAVTLVDTSKIGVQWQCPRRYVNNKPLKRFANLGQDLVGVFGHRDVTRHRGYHDPGDVIFDMLETRGFERFDFAAGEDLEVWSRRQEWLRDLGLYTGPIDGIAASGTTTALKHLGYPDGIFARWRELAERPPMPPC